MKTKTVKESIFIETPGGIVEVKPDNPMYEDYKKVYGVD